MIYFLAEYCLNSLNGTFFSSAGTILKSDLEYTKLFPLGSLYVGLVGINTMNVSVILSQLMFLYHLFYSIDYRFGQFVRSTIARDTILSQCINTLVSYIPIVPLLISLSLHSAYISYSNKCKALLTRILYTLCQQVVQTVLNIVSNLCSNAVLRMPFISMPLNFCLNYLLVHTFSIFYRTSERMASASVLSFAGTYFFLKTYTKNPLLCTLVPQECSFPTNIANTSTLMPYALFGLLFVISILSQKLIGMAITKYRCKNGISMSEHRNCDASMPDTGITK